MPKSRKVGKKGRRKTGRELFRDGFLFGIFLGAAFSLIALGHIYASVEFRAFAKFLVLLAFVFGWVITIYYGVTGRVFFGSKRDGLIAGFTLSAQTVDWVLHGF